MLKPGFVVFECRILAVFAHARPQAPHEMRGALQVDVNKNFAVHLSVSRDPVDKAQCKKHRRTIPDRHAGVALFEPVQGHAADRGWLCEDRNGNASPSAGVANVLPKLAECPQDRYRESG